MKRIAVSVITPDKPVWEGDVESLVVPAHEGQLGVWPGHAPLLAQLKPGAVVLRAGGEPVIFSVSGGFIEVNQGRVAVFVETAEHAEEIDAERARQAEMKARAALKATPADKMDLQALAALERALARLRATELAARRGGKRGAPSSPQD
ncbi:MAG: ATP synthase F1 subunit epsilon [Elusimicrobia bacterium]|nr:ATP synthase F1 subunit epsilon [Elusimicrobiota bacterium]MBK7207132.1 ATP synthase F1 subunit epsilon [Elusimicrobiota bacterium]MBK7574814.1 ATP synthase F1 subunit epsilon [Elusimicrobiota bacterium]MBK8125548.1 ATP synthase F1 subunit epsilon [Elusimicrobiota bacterium]MBK8423165.1 ATP synthase F1 subunit epsilon [Elusimicrobiota bacterium]